jgi:hypothetical protein
MARKRQRTSSASLTEPQRTFKHNLQLLVGNPCRHCGSTSPSLVHSIPPSNWRSPHCNRKEGRGYRQERNRRSAQGSPCHAPCSTTPSCPQTIQPPSWRSHQRSCKGRQEELARWALAAALALASASGLAEGIRRDGSCSTTTSCLPATCPVCPPRNCKGRLDRQAEAPVLGEEASLAVSVEVWAAGLAAVSAAEWAAELLVPEWGSRFRSSGSSTAAALATTPLLLQGQLLRWSSHRARRRQSPTRARATAAATGASSAGSMW